MPLTSARAHDARVNVRGPRFALPRHMNLQRHVQHTRVLLAVFCTVAIAPGDTLALVFSRAQTQTSAASNEAPRIPSDQLDSLVAPIALYPDQLLVQTLA